MACDNDNRWIEKVCFHMWSFQSCMEILASVDCDLVFNVLLNKSSSIMSFRNEEVV